MEKVFFQCDIFFIIILIGLGLWPLASLYNADKGKDEMGIDRSLFGWGVLGLVIIWLLSGVFVYITWEQGNRGEIGDMFGAINALFSGLALIGVVIAIILQKKELEETRDVFVEQSKTMEMQRFENTFFNMVGLHIRSMEEMKIEDELDIDYVEDTDNDVAPSLIKGYESMEYLYSKLESFFSDFDDEENAEEQLAKIKEAFNFLSVELNHGKVIAIWLKSIGLVMELIERRKIIHKEYYAAVFSTQMSDKERLFLFYYCLSKIDEDDSFVNLTLGLGLFKNIKLTEVFNNNHDAIYNRYRSDFLI